MVHSRLAVAQVPTEFGEFEIYVFDQTPFGEGPIALVHGEPVQDGQLVAVHRGCLASEVLHTTSCGCRARLHRLLREISREPTAILLYFPPATPTPLADWTRKQGCDVTVPSLGCMPAPVWTDPQTVATLERVLGHWSIRSIGLLLDAREAMSEPRLGRFPITGYLSVPEKPRP